MLGIIRTKVSTTIYIGVVVTWFLTKAQRSPNNTTAIKMTTRFLIDFFLSILTPAFTSTEYALLPQHIVCIQYAILFFSFCQQRLLLRTIKKLNALYRQPNTVHSAAFITACSHTTKMQKALILIETILWGQLRFRGGAF